MEGIHQIERDKTSLCLSITASLTGIFAPAFSRGREKSVQLFESTLALAKGSKLTLLCEVRGIYGSEQGDLW